MECKLSKEGREDIKGVRDSDSDIAVGSKDGKSHGVKRQLSQYGSDLDR